jgi:hypothetical protein
MQHATHHLEVSNLSNIECNKQSTFKWGMARIEDDLSSGQEKQTGASIGALEAKQLAVCVDESASALG